HFGLAVGLAHGRRRRTRLQTHARRGAFSLGERLVEGAEICPELFLRRRSEGRLVVVNQHHESHVVRSLYTNDAGGWGISTGPPLSNGFVLTRHVYEKARTTMKVTTKSIWYWITTGVVVFAMFSGGIAELAHRPETIDGMKQLGYPVYFVMI